MIVRPYGVGAVLVEPADPATVLPLAAAVAGVPGVTEVVPAARTLLVAGDAAELPAITVRLREIAGTLDPATAPAGPEVELEVRYDGPDLASTATLLGIAVDELVARHAAGRYVVAFCGFAPGFAYLTGLDADLRAPRLAEPRTRVPAGAVGIADEFTGVYPRASPGGWRLLGRTDAPLWDLARTPPALLAPGTRVHFRPA